MNQPLFYSSRIESDHRQSITHCFRSDHAKGLRPNGRNYENTRIKVELLQLVRRNKAAELHPVSQVEPGAEPLAIRAMIPVSQNEASERHRKLRQCLQQQIDTFAANDLSSGKNQVSTAK